MWKKVDDYIKEQKMFAAEDVVIAGVSGGADSMCLLCVLDKWRKRLGFHLVVVHVNHGLRGETADAEEAYVKSVCDDRELPFESYHFDVRAVAAKEKLSEEEAGRKCRRRAFEDAALRYGGTKIALAHHKNDNAETFLFHLARGSRLKGLGGMKPVSGIYVRPLLCVCREEIEAYLRERQISFCIDESNQTDSYSRNRIRNHVLPYLVEEVNAQAVEHIDQTMEYFRRVQEYLEKQVDMLWEKAVAQEPDGKICISETILEEEAILREMLLKEALGKAAGREKDLTEIHVKALEELFGKQVGRRLDLPYQLIAVRTYQGIELYPQERLVTERADSMDLDFCGASVMTWEYQGYQIEARIFPKEECVSIPKKPFTKWFDYDIIKKNVCVRTRMPGDKIIIGKEGGSQKLKNFFINEKIPACEREKVLLFAEGSQILWIVGYRQSMGYQVSEQTKRILEITVSGGN